VTPATFRRLALELPEAIESAHRDHPDFRVGGKIFATLAPGGEPRGMVKLTVEQQAQFTRDDPKMFATVSGGWGRGGATSVLLAAASEAAVRRALLAAWRNTAPEKLLSRMDHP
jgi:hypothetical protein